MLLHWSIYWDCLFLTQLCCTWIQKSVLNDSYFFIDIYCFVTQLSSLFLRSGYLKDMESIEKSQVRKNSSAKLRIARTSSAISTKIPHSGKLASGIFYIDKAPTDRKTRVWMRYLSVAQLYDKSVNKILTCNSIYDIASNYLACRCFRHWCLLCVQMFYITFGKGNL